MISHDEAVRLIEGAPEGLDDLLARAASVRDAHGRVVTFSAKVFVPLTTLCRDDCGYCTFRRDPGQPGAHTMTPEEVIALCRAGARLGAKEALVAIRDLHERYGHVQEVIVQNFRAKPFIPMRDAPEPTFDALLRALAVARLVLPPDVALQAPPNLSPRLYPQLLAAGLNDWGGI